MLHIKLILIFLGVLSLSARAQDSAQKLSPTGYLEQVSQRAGALSQKLDKKTEQVLDQVLKQDQKIYRKLLRKDSTKAKAFIESSKARYAALVQKLKSPPSLSTYIPQLDTLKTSLSFLGSGDGLVSKLKDNKSLAGALSKVEGLEKNFSKAEDLKTFLNERRTQMIQQLKDMPFAKELKKLNKQAYYYAAQVSEYKEMLKDKKKMERKALELLAKSKAFQDFMKKNSMLASLFRLPGGEDGAGGGSGGLSPGLQTRAQVTSLIKTRIAAGGPGAAEQVRANMQDAQAQLSTLKQKMESYRAGGFGSAASEMDMPEGSFKPNNQKTKPFLKRLEVGTNLQSQKARFMFPVTSDLGLSLGYKLNDRSIVGLGASYKLGLGTGFDNISLTHQGAGVRSFIDYKLKGSFYLSGGYEQNYRTLFNSVEQLRDYSAWQKSGLLGVTKKYKVSKKLKGNMQLLWDFLSQQQVPKTQTILFRIGYSLK